MPSHAILIKVGILILSFIFGISYFYFISKNDKEYRKKQIEDNISLIINFILFIWLSKIIIHFDKFIQDPLSILAYPSDSHAFYLATIFIVINLLYRKYRHRQQIVSIVEAFLPIFIATSFIYEFLQIVVEKNETNVYYLVLLTFLLIVYTIIHGKISKQLLLITNIAILLVGQWILALFTNMTLFHYRMSPYYYVILFIVSLVLTIYSNKRKV